MQGCCKKITSCSLHPFPTIHDPIHDCFDIILFPCSYSSRNKKMYLVRSRPAAKNTIKEEEWPKVSNSTHAERKLSWYGGAIFASSPVLHINDSFTIISLLHTLHHYQCSKKEMGIDSTSFISIYTIKYFIHCLALHSWCKANYLGAIFCSARPPNTLHH